MTDVDLKLLRVNRGNIKAQLTNFENILKPISKETITHTLTVNINSRLQKIETLFDIFNDLQNQIEYLTIDDAEQYNKECIERDKFHDLYFESISIAKVLLVDQNVDKPEKFVEQNLEIGNTATQFTDGDNLSVASARELLSESQNRLRCSIKLPTIKLPNFDGTFTAWRGFFDAFSTLIHSNEDLTDIQKLTNLKLSVTGEPYDLISTLETTEINYPIALNILKKRYDNKRRIINTHISKILNMQQISCESASQFREMINAIQTHINCLRSFNLNVDSWDAILVPLLVSKLDNQSAKEWETKLNLDNANRDEIPTLSDLIEFLTSKLLTLEVLGVKCNEVKPKHSSRSFTAAVTQKIPVCPNCNKDHTIYNCELFLKLDDKAKNNLARKIKLCINCLRKGHFLNDCHSTSKCKICDKKHHTLLHINYKNNNNEPKTTDSKESQSEETNVKCHSVLNLNSQTLLSTAIVAVRDNEGRYQTAKLLLDSASQSNFITEGLCKALSLKRTPINMNVIGINQSTLSITHSVEIIIKSRTSNFSVKIKCLVVPKISTAIPTYSFDRDKIHIPVNIKLSDPKFYESSSIDLLIGANIFWQLTCIGQIQQESIVFQKTKLGWILGGELLGEKLNKQLKAFSHSYLTMKSLNESIERFWNFDEFKSITRNLSQEELQCETYFLETTERDNNGKFIVKIPFKPNLSELSNTYQLAKYRFERLEKRFEHDKDLKEEYSKFMNEYIALGHMTEVKFENKDETAFYLPRHCVIKESSETTKLRVVFDGSCKAKNELSLNEVQFTGPSLQDDIFSIMSRFRLHEYVFTADIAKMYRQVWVHPQHRKYQRIFWRENLDDDISVYELNTITYGTTSAPFLAVRCLLQLADEFKTNYPVESRIIQQDFYMDDLITGCDNLNTLIAIKQNVCKILNSGGFELRKFKSNMSELRDINIISDQPSAILDTSNKVLGICWNPTTDLFSYSFDLTFKQTEITKRTILALTAHLYDPLGLLAPIIVSAKLIIQELWQLKLNWDESVPMQLFCQWNKFKNSLRFINEITVHRKLLIANHVKIELHAYSNASEKAYGTCIYLKSYDQTNNIRIALLAAKSRIAPLKKVTLPRLELLAAVLSAQLVEKFKNILNIKLDKEYFWCDSQIALAWIKSDPNRWKPYVSNRSINDWFYVKSVENPADLISRGISPEKLVHSSLWWEGPHWLSHQTLNFNDKKSLCLEELPEGRKIITVLQTNTNIPEDIVETRLKRVIAFCLRFASNARKPKDCRNYGTLTVSELSDAFTKVVKIVQQKHFAQEFSTLLKDGSIHKKSKLLSLTPFLDTNNIMRVGGRLRHSTFSYDKKHPILLPNHCKLSKLILEHEHKSLMHASPKLILNSVRDKFWPIQGMNLAKKVVRECKTCAKLTAKPVNPFMGDLPYERTAANYPFHSTGVDYAGPYSIKDRSGRGAQVTKCYVCLYICFSTKAMHLELVTNLTSDNFLLSFKRFISRRGKPKNIFSDNGSNFVGANNELIKLGQFLEQNYKEIQNYASNYGVQWHFIPPRSPTFGGLWEAGVKNVIYHLSRILTNVTLTYEEFSTVLAQIESILNSRPLIPLTSDPNDLEPLTPAHLLIGRTFTSIPDPDLTDIPQNRLTRYQLLQKLNVHFWKKWSSEYIHQLQQRTKWTDNDVTKAINEGAMVILKDENLPPAQWRLGRVIQLHPGQDGIARVVSVQCANGVYKRATNRVCLLPIQT